MVLDMFVQVGNSCAWAVPIPAASSILQSILPASHQALERCACSSGHPGPWSMGPGNIAAQEIDPLGCAVGMDAWEKSLASLSCSAAHPRLWCPVSFPRLHLAHLTGDPWLPHHPATPPAPYPGQGTQGRARSPSHIQPGGEGTRLPILPAPPESPTSAGRVIRTNPGAGFAEPLSSLLRSRSAAVQSVCKAVQSVYAAGTGPGD